MLEKEKVKVLELIDPAELKDLILELGNIPSPWGHEAQVCQYVYDWLKENGFNPRKVGLDDERFNVVAVVKGSGEGKDLIFNAHMDTAYSPHDYLIMRNCDNPFYTTAWAEGDLLYGEGVQNDKGPLACLLIAAKAIKNSGIKLKGDLIVTAVCGEIGQEPVDEFQGLDYVGKDIGAHWMMVHGGIYADYALVAEGTDFTMSWIEAGKAFFKVTIYGKSAYTPWLQRTPEKEKSTITFLRASRFVDAFETWALQYEKENTYECEGGTLVPKAQISAIRGGHPYYLTKGSELCHIYIDVRIVPKQDPRVIRDSLQQIIDNLGVEGEVELILFRPGYEAENISGLVKALSEAHVSEIGQKPQKPIPPFSSMWRDTNVFNEFGIPALTYGPPRYCPIKVESMVKATKIYARTALTICNEVK
jgi:acetylornithine deacetylase/succinyl-diaminopimelate desuccinylase-like protein